MGPWLNKGLFAGHSERLVRGTRLKACTDIGHSSWFTDEKRKACSRETTRRETDKDLCATYSYRRLVPEKQPLNLFNDSPSYGRVSQPGAGVETEGSRPDLPAHTRDRFRIV